MSQMILNQILNQLQRLELSELQQLDRVLQQYLKEKDELVQRAAFHQALVETGLVRQIKTPSVEPGTRQPLLQIQDGAVSQTILEERR